MMERTGHRARRPVAWAAVGAAALTTTLALAVAVSLLALPAAARAQGDPVLVIGLGLGGHRFADSDDVRRADAVFDEIDRAGTGHLYAEWYLFDTVGLGLRSLVVTAEEEAAAPGTAQTRTVTASAVLVTANWVVAGAGSPVRLALMAGAGPAEYEAGLEGGSGTGTGNTDGTATLLGAYVDWGGDALGARFGVQALGTDYDELNGASVDAGGTSATLDLRWAF